MNSSGHTYIGSVTVNYIQSEKGELKDHLGNVRVVVNDIKEPRDTADYTKGFTANAVAYYNYYPFGSLMPGRNFNAQDYRFGFNGQEKDDEITGVTGSHYTAMFWEYDSRIGRRWNKDPKPNPSISNYACFSNNPIYHIDILGDTTWNFNTKSGKFMGFTDLDKTGNIGMALTQTEKINGRSKTYTTTVDAVFAFNDIELDREKILSGEMTLNLITENEIDKAMDFNGVKTEEAKNNPLTYIERESRPVGDASLLSGKSTGLLDHFSTSPIVKKGALNVVLMPNSKSGIGYNDMDFGNFLWGHAGKMLGFNTITLLNAAHLNNAVNGRSDNPGKDIPLLDAAADQRAIFMGTIYPVKK